MLVVGSDEAHKLTPISYVARLTIGGLAASCSSLSCIRLLQRFVPPQSIGSLSLHVETSLTPISVLDVSRDADDRTIKKQYRKLSRKYHPDKNSDAGAEDKFMEIGKAFEVLSNEGAAASISCLLDKLIQTFNRTRAATRLRSGR